MYPASKLFQKSWVGRWFSGKEKYKALKEIVLVLRGAAKCELWSPDEAGAAQREQTPRSEDPGAVAAGTDT